MYLLAKSWAFPKELLDQLEEKYCKENRKKNQYYNAEFVRWVSRKVKIHLHLVKVILQT